MKLPLKLTYGMGLFLIGVTLYQIYFRRLFNSTIPPVTVADIQQWWWAFLVLCLMLLDISFYAGFFYEQLPLKQSKLGLIILALAGGPLLLTVLSSLIVFQGTCTYKRLVPCSYLDFLFDFMGGFGAWTFGTMLWFLAFIAVWGIVVMCRELFSYSVS